MGMALLLDLASACDIVLAYRTVLQSCHHWLLALAEQLALALAEQFCSCQLMCICYFMKSAYLSTVGLAPLLELSLTAILAVNDHIDLVEPSRHESASSAIELLELCGFM